MRGGRGIGYVCLWLGARDVVPWRLQSVGGFVQGGLEGGAGLGGGGANRGGGARGR